MTVQNENNESEYARFRLAIINSRSAGKLHPNDFQKQEKRYQLAKKVINQYKEELIEQPFRSLVDKFISTEFYSGSPHVAITVKIPKNLTKEEQDSLCHTDVLKNIFLIKLLEETMLTDFRLDIVQNDFVNNLATSFQYRFSVSEYLF